MKIAFDIRRVRSFGIGTYIRNVVRTLARLDRGHRYVLIGSPESFHEMGPLPQTFELESFPHPESSARNFFEFQQIVSRQGNSSWRIETGTEPDLRPYEVSMVERRAAVGVWGHLIGPDGAVAFGIPGMADAPGTYTVALDGRGQASYRFAPLAGAGTTLRLAVYQHFVSTPVAIGAATTPASMLNPPRVIVE